MSTSQKHADFIREIMDDKPVEAIAGVGDKAKVLLNERGYIYAYNLVGQFLVLNKDEALFNEWLISNACSMNNIMRDNCISCIKTWCERFL